MKFKIQVGNLMIDAAVSNVSEVLEIAHSMGAECVYYNGELLFFLFKNSYHGYIDFDTDAIIHDTILN